MRETLFTIVSIFTIAVAAGVVFSRNAIYSAFSLILTFFGLAALFLLWDAEFLAMVQILIYAGAIVVLFIFVVMLLNLEQMPMRLFSFHPVIVAVSATAVWCLTLLLLRVLNHSPAFQGGTTLCSPLGGLRPIALLLFREYLWPFEILSFFLLALVVAIFALTHSPHEKQGEKR